MKTNVFSIVSFRSSVRPVPDSLFIPPSLSLSLACDFAALFKPLLTGVFMMDVWIQGRFGVFLLLL